MKNILTSKYENYYNNSDSEWRFICAIDKANNIVNMCNNYPHQKILEIGAGDGSILQNLDMHNFGTEYTALDISQSAIDKTNNKNINRLIRSEVFDGYNLPFDSEKFDLVILSHVVEHLEYPRQLLYEAARVGKHIFVEVPCEDNFGLNMNYVDNGVGHINYYTPKTIRRLMQTTDLDVCEQRTTIPSYGVYKYIHKNRYNSLFRYLLKKVMLLLFPSISINIFTYHSSLLCVKKKI